MESLQVCTPVDFIQRQYHKEQVRQLSSITGYAYAQGMQENVLAVVRGVGAACGIAGSFAFPSIRRRIGLQRTGLLSSSLQLIPLSLCVISVFLPDSIFDVYGYYHPMSPNATIDESEILALFNATNENSNSTTTKISIATTQATTVGGATVSIWVFLAGVVFARFGMISVVDRIA